MMNDKITIQEEIIISKIYVIPKLKVMLNRDWQYSTA